MSQTLEEARRDASAAVLARVTEPFGGRDLAGPFEVGSAASCAVRIPVAGDCAYLRVERVAADSAWSAVPLADAGAVRCNGEPLREPRELRGGDVLAIGDTRLIVLAVAPRLLVDVRHLGGNATLEPVDAGRSVERPADEGDAIIVAAVLDLAAAGPSEAPGPSAAGAGGTRARPRWGVWAAGVAVLALLGGALAFVGRVERVALRVVPSDARVSAGFPSWRAGDVLFALPGERRIVATADGYETLARDYTVRQGARNALTLQLTKKPGVLAIDTGGVAASVTVDGAPAGRAPGEISAAAGSRTLTLRADRYLDAVVKVDVEGAGARQDVRVTMRSAWGRVEVSALTAGAVLTAGGRPPVVLPGALDLPAGVHSLRVSAPGARDWVSSVLVKAGETQVLGPIELGAPDARLMINSSPSGANVTVAGEFRGRTPLALALAPAARYDVLVTRPGYTSFSRNVEATAAQQIRLFATLEPILVPLTVQGEPAGAEVWIDGTRRGSAPLTTQALATRQRLEVRQTGRQTYVAEVDLTGGIARTVEYRLVPEGRPADWQPPPESLDARFAGSLRLVGGASFTMGSDRREPGRRANEFSRRVSLVRPFYIGTREVTNGEFRRFRAGHASGIAQQRSIDLDGQAVTGVSWNDAVEYCNWLSEQEGLVAAYEKRDGQWTLRQPVPNGYRLPTEAEWEYAARAAPGGTVQRYAWGNALPVPANVANLAGSESALPATLEGYRDDDVAVARPARFAANALGLFDTTGNVSEWVNDRYSSAPEVGQDSDPLGPASGGLRVFKGSNWRTASFAELRLAWREGADPATGSNDRGFRVARYAD